jgi:DNA-directed RNA polymerase subunit RPC12/RpoP
VRHYRCLQCSRRWRRSECILDDDEMAPFGRELLCPACGGLVLQYTPPWLMIAAVCGAFLITAIVAWLRH